MNYCEKLVLSFEKGKVKKKKISLFLKASLLVKEGVIYVFLFLFLVKTPLIAQKSNPITYPEELQVLDSYFRMAAEQNPELASLKADIEAQEERISQLSTLVDPEVSVSYFINPPNDASFFGRFRVSVMQMFPWFGTLHVQGKVQEHIGEEMGHSLDQRQLAIFSEIQDLWFTYYKLNHHVHVNREVLQLIKDLEKQMEVQYETGETGQVDLLRLQMEEHRLLNRIEKLEDEKNPVQERFNALLNRDLHEAISTPNNLPQRELPWTKEELFRFVRNINPKFSELEAREKRYKQQGKLARLAGRPSFGLGLEYMGSDFGFMNMMSEMNEGFFGMATIRIPLYRGKYNAQKREVQSQLRANDARQTELFNQFHSELERAMKNFRDTQREHYLITEELLPRSEQVLKILLDEYTTGRADFNELIKAFRELLSLENEQVEVLSDQNKAMAAIEQLIANGLNKNKPH